MIRKFCFVKKAQFESQNSDKDGVIAALEAEKADLLELHESIEQEVKALRESTDNAEKLVKFTNPNNFAKSLSPLPPLVHTGCVMRDDVKNEFPVVASAAAHCVCEHPN